MKNIIILLLCCLLLTGCVEPVPPLGTIPTDPATEAPTEKLTEAPTVEITEPVPVTVTIYHGNENVDGFDTAEVQVEEIDMNVLVDQLIAHNVLPEGVAIQGLKVDGTTLYMDFNAAFGAHVCSMGTSGEYIVIGSVVNTFLDAFGCDSAYITVDNEILESGHNVYDFELTRFN